MSSTDLATIDDALSLPPGTAQALVGIMREAVRQEIRDETARLGSRLREPRPVPATPTEPVPAALARKYTYDEVRLRLHTGRDPAHLSDGERADGDANAPSVSTIRRLVARGHLARVKLSGLNYVTEAQVRAYERKVGEGKIRQPARRRGGRRETVADVASA